MSDYRTVGEVYDKVDWEGGLFETAFGYGLTAESFEDNDNLRELKAAWAEMHRVFKEHFEPAYDKVDEILSNYGEDD